MRIVRFAAVAATVVAWALTGCGGSGGDSSEAGETTTDTIPVVVGAMEAEDFVVYGDYYGDCQGVEEATLVSFMGGRVGAISAREGDWVKKGQSLGRIEAQKAENAFATAALNEKIAQSSYERAQRHFKQGTISEVALDQAKLAWLNGKSSRIEAGKARDGALCITPMSGLVLSRYIRLHDELPAGSPTYRVARISKILVTIAIPEGELEGVQEGNEAEVTIPVIPGRTWTATLRRLSREVASQSRASSAELIVENDDGAIRPGMTAHVKLVRQRLEDQIVAPTSAVLADDKGSYVMVAEGNVGRRRAITLGPSNGERTVVVSGLAAGDDLVVEGQHLLADNMPLTIQKRR